MYRIIIISAFSCLLYACGAKKEVNFLNNYAPNPMTCNSDGNPKDSLVYYFPQEYFIKSQKKSPGDSSKVQTNNSNLGTYNRTLQGASMFEMTGSFYLWYYSYALFKMNEPVLYDHSLNKEIFRMTSFRANCKPLMVRVEKYKGKISVVSKKLNRDIRSPYTTKYSTNDSIAEKLNTIDYYPKVDTTFSITKSEWNLLVNLLSSSGFWSSNTNNANIFDYPRVDGSIWIFESHNKNGYKMIMIPDPEFKKGLYRNEYDTNNYYSRIFRNLLNLGAFNKEPFIF
jgi:hypothetical protein